jgi:hypothetical protein
MSAAHLVTYCSRRTNIIVFLYRGRKDDEGNWYKLKIKTLDVYKYSTIG